MPKPPNLLVIQTDQQSCWTLGAYGGSVVGTPHIDSLAREGVVFEQCFTNSAVCTPSRGCLITGLHPHVHGAWHNELAMHPGVRTLADVFGEAGYDTGYVGKWHLDGLPPEPPAWKPNDWTPGGLLPARPGWVPPERSRGFADCRWMFQSSHAKGVVEVPGAEHPSFSPDPAAGRFMTDWLADKAIEFLSRPRSAPFFCMLSIPDPHEPYAVREPYAGMYDPAAMPVPRSFREPRPPHWTREGLEGCCSALGGPDPEDRLRRTMATYCGEVRCIDDNVGRVLGRLRELGLLDDTLVVFTSDHGDYMGEHGLYGKNRAFETAYRIPMIMRWPRSIPAGGRIGRVTSTVDFMPTVLGLMGLKCPAGVQGADASAFATGGSGEWDDAALFGHSHFDLVGVFTPDFELALWRSGEGALFSRRDDPDQLSNLIAEPAFAAVRRELRDRVIEHNRKTGSPAAQWLGNASA